MSIKHESLVRYFVRVCIVCLGNTWGRHAHPHLSVHQRGELLLGGSHNFWVTMTDVGHSNPTSHI